MLGVHKEFLPYIEINLGDICHSLMNNIGKVRGLSYHKCYIFPVGKYLSRVLSISLILKNFSLKLLCFKMVGILKQSNIKHHTAVEPQLLSYPKGQISQEMKVLATWHRCGDLPVPMVKIVMVI